MALTDMAIKSLVAKDKAYSVADGEGLQLEVSPNGLKVWRYCYRMNGAKGKQEKLTFGRYLEISLSEARLKRSEFKSMVNSGLSPAKLKRQQKKAVLESDTLEDFALNWVANIVALSNKNPAEIERVLKADIFPFIGHKQIQAITQSDILKITDKIRERGRDTAALAAKRVLNRVFDYAISTEKITFNPAAAIQNRHIATQSPRPRELSKAEISLLFKTVYGSAMTRGNKLALPCC